MKSLSLILIFLIPLVLTACGGKGSSNPASPAPGTPTPDSPAPSEQTIEWGDLQCQKAQNCDNPVLNFSKKELTYYFEIYFAKPLEHSDPDFLVFRCGRKFSDSWTEYFGNVTSPDPEDLVGNFQMEMMNLRTCVHVKDLNQALNTYFISTKEYKNEIN